MAISTSHVVEPSPRLFLAASHAASGMTSMGWPKIDTARARRMSAAWLEADDHFMGTRNAACARQGRIGDGAKTGAPALAWKWLRHRWLDWTGQAGIVARAGNCAMAAPAQLPGPARI